MTRQAISGKRLSVWTALPTTPVDGDEIIYRFLPTQTPATTIPLLWHLRWDAAVAAWLPVGQQEPIVAGFLTGATVSMGVNAWGTYDANDPRLTTPRAGVYEMETGISEAYGPMNGFYCATSINGTAPGPAQAESSRSGGGPNDASIGGAMQVKVPEQTLAVGDIIRQFYYLWAGSGPQNIVIRGRYIQIRPKKITG